MAIKDVQIHGWLADVRANFELLKAFFSGAPGLGGLRVARWEFDVTEEDSAGELNAETGAHGTGITLPAHAIVVGGFMDVNTPFTSENTNNATIAIHVEGANDIQTAAAVSGAPWSTKGRKAIVPKANTPESTSVKTTVARQVTATVATSELLTGKVTGYLYYVEGLESADLPESS
jgi:hypothetical protein